MWYLACICLGWLVLAAVTSDPGLAWTYTHLAHGAASYWLLHWTKGGPGGGDQGAYDKLTVWEQVGRRCACW